MFQVPDEGMSTRPLCDGVLAGPGAQQAEEPFLLPDRYCSRTPEGNSSNRANKKQTNIFWQQKNLTDLGEILW